MQHNPHTSGLVAVPATYIVRNVRYVVLLMAIFITLSPEPFFCSSYSFLTHRTISGRGPSCWRPFSQQVISARRGEIQKRNEAIKMEAGGGGQRSLRSIIVSGDRMMAPGEKRVMHIYDKNNLKVLKKAAGSDGIMCLVLLDPDALANRSFALSSVGCECKVLSVEKTTKIAREVNGFEGGSSSSRLVELVGINRLQVKPNAVQREPFVIAQVSKAVVVGGVDEQKQSEIEAGIVASVEALASLGNSVFPADAWTLSLHERVQYVKDSGGWGAGGGSGLADVAIIATYLLEEREKVHAMAIQDEAALAEYVGVALKDRLAKLAAIKALKDLSKDFKIE